MKPIVYIEYGEIWLFDGTTFTPCDSSAIKKYQVGTCVPLSRLHIGSFKFLSSLGEMERQIQTEIKMHEEGGLNPAQEYEIAAYNHTLEFENSTIVEAFACSRDALNEYYGDFVKKNKVLDWIVPSFITYESFYKRNEVEPQTDLFFYLGDRESYAVLFHHGTYIAHRRTSSVEALAKAINVDTQRCKNMLSSYGLSEENYPAEEKVFFDQLQLTFSKEVEKIIHTLNHKRGLFGIESIDQIYVDFNANTLEGLDKIYAAYGMENIPIQTLVCEKDKSINAHRFAKATYLYLCANDQIESPLNLSPYERRAAWHKRYSGQLIAVSAAALVLGMIHPLYYYGENAVLKKKISLLQSSLQQIEERSKGLSEKLQSIRAEVAKGEAKLKTLHDGIRVYELTLESLPVLMQARDIRQKMMYDAIDILEQYRLSTVSMEQNGTKSMQIHVIADYAQRATIAKFMQRWMETGYKEASTNEIYLDKNIYESKIEVLR
jgi:hypothetical protein